MIVNNLFARFCPYLQVLDTLLHRVMWRYTKAHMQSTRSDLSEGQLLGEERLHEDFLAQVALCVYVWFAPSNLCSCAWAYFRKYGVPPTHVVREYSSGQQVKFEMQTTLYERSMYEHVHEFRWYGISVGSSSTVHALHRYMSPHACTQQ